MTATPAAQALDAMPAPKAQRAHGGAQLRFSGPAARLDLDQRWPMRVLSPLGGDDPARTTLLCNTAGGVAGGDRLTTAVTATDGATVRILPQAAEKLYRSAGEDAQISLSLTADGTATRLEHVPMPTILFQGARLRRRTTLAVTNGARLAHGDILCFGRAARGEMWTEGLLDDQIRVMRDDRLIWVDRLGLSADNLAQAADHPAGLAGARWLATLIAVQSHEDQAALLLDHLRQDLAALDQDPCRWAGTRFGAVVVLRAFATDGSALYQQMGLVWPRIRHLSLDLPAAMPRSWHL